MNRTLPMLVLCALPLAACSDRSSEPAASGTPDPALVSAGASPAEPAASTSPASPAEATTTERIPAAMQGRFGLVPADCTSTRGDAKGLVTISGKDLRFYESVAALKRATPTSPTRLRGSFAYSGEGMEWSREVALESRDGGKTVIMEEFGDDAPPGPRTYTRCD